MKTAFTKQRVAKFLSYYKPHQKIFIMDMFFVCLSSIVFLLFPLVARFYDVTKGRVIIDGVDSREISMESLRKHVGIVKQEVYIFNGIIKESVTNIVSRRKLKI